MINDDDLNSSSLSGPLYKGILGSTALFEDNPDSPILSDILSDTDLTILTASTFPGSIELDFSPEEIEAAANKIKTDKINPYKRQPIPFDDQIFFPEYFRRKKAAEKGFGTTYFDPIDPYRTSPIMTGEGPEDVRKPIGYDKIQTSLRYGVDPRLTFEDASFRTALSFYTGQNPTPKDINHMLDNFQIPGSDKKGYRDQYPYAVARYIAPNDPSVGIRIDNVRFDEEGKSIPLTYDPATFDGPTDIGEFILDEALPIAAETGLVYLQARRGFLNEFLRKVPKGKGATSRVLTDGLTFNTLLSGSAAFARFGQRAAGVAVGAHDRSMTEIAEESGMLFAFNLLGNQGLDILLKGLPKLWNAATGRDVTPQDLKELELAWEDYTKSAAGDKIDLPFGESEAFTIKDIKEAGERLGVEMSYKPSLSRGSRREWVQRIESALLDGQNQPKIAKILDKLGKGDAEYTKAFFEAMFKELDENVTGATIGPEIRALIDDGQENFVKEGQQIFAQLRQNVSDILDNNVPDFKIVDDAASDRIIERTTNRLEVTRRNFLDETSEQVDNVFTDAGIADTNINIKGLLTPIKQFRDKGNKKITGPNYEPKLVPDEYFEAFRQLFPDPDLFLKRGSNLTLNDLVNLQKAAGRISGTTKSGVVKQDLFNLQGAINDQIAASLNTLVRNGTIDTVTKNSIIDTLQTANSRFTQANAQGIVELAKTSPTDILKFIAKSNRKNAPYNETMREVVQFLRDAGDEDTLKILRQTMIEDFQRVLDNPGNQFTGEEIARAYKLYLDDYGPALKELFDDADLKKLYKNPDEFQTEIIAPLERLSRDKKLFSERFGNRSTFNIITDIVSQSGSERLAGKTIDDLDFIMNLIEGNDALKRDVANAYKLYVKGMLQDARGNLSINNLKKLLEDGHIFNSIDDASNLSARRFHQLLLGGDNEFTTNLFILEELIAKSKGVMGVYGDLAGAGNIVNESSIAKQLIKDSTDPKINYLKRFFIPPLTQTGRRITAAEKHNTETSLRFLSRLITEPKLLDRYLAALRTRERIIPFIKQLEQIDTRLAMDVKFGLSYYDKDKKEEIDRGTPPSLFLNPEFLPFIGTSNSRINQIMEETANE
tara:strand:+ start:2132 stop:5464 length:3333 start_codon:yes stop_codon:yes gene_type:complete